MRRPNSPPTTPAMAPNTVFTASPLLLTGARATASCIVSGSVRRPFWIRNVCALSYMSGTAPQSCRAWCTIGGTTTKPIPTSTPMMNR